MEFSGIRVDSAGLILTFLNYPGKRAIVPMSMARKFITNGESSIYELDNPPQQEYFQARPRYPKTNALESLKILDSCLSSLAINKKG
jgi:hypothetical protein